MIFNINSTRGHTGSLLVEINNTRKPPEFPDNVEVFRV